MELQGLLVRVCESYVDQWLEGCLLGLMRRAGRIPRERVWLGGGRHRRWGIAGEGQWVAPPGFRPVREGR